jgi:hypothetical protein
VKVALPTQLILFTLLTLLNSPNPPDLTNTPSVLSSAYRTNPANLTTPHPPHSPRRCQQQEGEGRG